jgi:hypothetical protein
VDDEVQFPARTGIFSLRHRVQTDAGAHPTSYEMVPGAFSQGVKQPGREVKNSPSSNSEVKNIWSYTSIPQYVFIAWCLIKNRGNFTFYTFTHFTGMELIYEQRLEHDSQKRTSLTHFAGSSPANNRYTKAHLSAGTLL